MKIFKVKTLLSILFLTFCFTFLSCSDDDSIVEPIVEEVLCTAVIPSSNLTTYVGTLSYTSANGDVISNPIDGEATLQESGGEYIVSFSDGVPSLENLCFNSDGTSYISVTAVNSQSGVTIDGDELVVSLTVDDNNYGFSGEK